MYQNLYGNKSKIIQSNTKPIFSVITDHGNPFENQERALLRCAILEGMLLHLNQCIVQ